MSNAVPQSGVPNLDFSQTREWLKNDPNFLAWVQAQATAPPPSTNIGLASKGATYTTPTGALDNGGLATLGDGNRTTNNAYNPSSNTFVSAGTASVGSPVIVVCDLGQQRTITGARIVGLRDATNYTDPPTDTEVSGSFRNINFTVDAWDGANWVNIGAAVGNTLVMKTFTGGSPVVGTKTRVVFTSGSTANIYLVEFETLGY